MEWLNSWWADVYEQIYATFVEGDRWQYLVKGIGNTIQIAFFAVLLGIVIGVIVALFFPKITLIALCFLWKGGEK